MPYPPTHWEPSRKATFIWPGQSASAAAASSSSGPAAAEAEQVKGEGEESAQPLSERSSPAAQQGARVRKRSVHEVDRPVRQVEETRFVTRPRHPSGQKMGPKLRRIASVGPKKPPPTPPQGTDFQGFKEDVAKYVIKSEAEAKTEQELDVARRAKTEVKDLLSPDQLVSLIQDDGSVRTQSVETHGGYYLFTPKVPLKQVTFKEQSAESLPERGSQTSRTAAEPEPERELSGDAGMLKVELDVDEEPATPMDDGQDVGSIQQEESEAPPERVGILGLVPDSDIIDDETRLNESAMTCP